METVKQPEPVSAPDNFPVIAEKLRSQAMRRLSSSQSRLLGRCAILAVIIGAAALLLAAFYREAQEGLSAVHPYVWLGATAALLIVVGGVAAGDRTALFIAVLFGVPLALPFEFLGNEGRALQRRARWLARFATERPRGYNTSGAHLAYGIIAVKKTIRRLCLRRENEDDAVRALRERRGQIVEERRFTIESVARALVTDEAEARSLSRYEYLLTKRLAAIDEELFARCLAIQNDVVGQFLSLWAKEHAEGHVPDAVYALSAKQFEQPVGEPPALLPNGLVRGPIAFAFEYGMFFGRLVLSILFLATLHVPFLLLALCLLALDFYVIEPVVLKLQISAMNLLLHIPGHKLIDLKDYVDALPDGAIFRAPITVPKYSSNPAWTNLSALIQSATAKAGVRTARVVPFSIFKGRRDTEIVLAQRPNGTPSADAESLKRALAAELAGGHAKLPLETAIRTEGDRVFVTLTSDEQHIVDLVGEDASQAFFYLRRNLESLADTVRHLGPKFVPVFVFASNSTDPDVIEYEVRELQALQRESDEKYGGQVGFVYLLRGGEWYNFNARLREFDGADKDFARSFTSFARGFALAPEAARERLKSALESPIDAKSLAAAFNALVGQRDFYRCFHGYDFEALPAHLHPTEETLAFLARVRSGARLSSRELRVMNRDLVSTAFPLAIAGNFFKKVGNDIPVQELLVAGKTRPTIYVDRRHAEQVQDPSLPSFVRVWGDFARYTGLRGTNAEIEEAILAGADLAVESVPEVGAVIDDKNHFAPGEVEKGIATMLHPENRHLVVGVPRINITFPRYKEQTMTSKYIVSAMNAREIHNSADAQSRARIFDFSSAAYGKWWHRPEPYLAHYAQEVLNSAHALSHDFQQSYFVAGASGRLGGFSEALYGTNHFRVRTLASRQEQPAK